MILLQWYRDRGGGGGGKGGDTTPKHLTFFKTILRYTNVALSQGKGGKSYDSKYQPLPFLTLFTYIKKATRITILTHTSL